MNKELLFDLPIESLSQNAKRLELAIEELHFLLEDLLQEKHELVTENRQLVEKVLSLTPDEPGIWNRMLKFAKNKWEAIFPVRHEIDVISEDRDEWSKIMRQMTEECESPFERFEVQFVDI